MKHTSKHLVIIGILMAASLGIVLFLQLLFIGNVHALACDVPTGPYPTIQSAVNDPSCDVLNLTAVFYQENVNINRSVTIQGQGAETTTVDGGGLTNVFRIQSGVAVTLTDITITNGYANFKSGGGGVYSIGSVVTIANSRIISNSAQTYGGGIYTAGIMTITNSLIDNNLGHISGGGIYNEFNSESRLSLINSTVSNNFTTAGSTLGGGVSNIGVLIVSGSTINNNFATQYGGGIYNGYIMTITNSTISGNSAPSFGGGIYTNYGSTALSNTTVTDNSANWNGGGIYNASSTTTLVNSIIANNPLGNDCAFQTAIVSLGHNIDSDASCNLTGSGDIVNTDPILGPLQDNNGPTATHALLEGSPAIDAGDDTTCLSVDQRGESRPQDGDGDGTAVCDIGAYEFTVSSVCDVPSATYATIQGVVGDPSCDVINLVASLYPENVTITRSVTIQGQGAMTTAVDGGGNGRVFTIQPGLTVALTDMTITNGYAIGVGGGILNSGASTTILNSAIISNVAEASGGGVSNSGVLTITNSRVAGNSSNSYGGGIYNGFQLSVVASMIVSNSAESGGGLFNYITSTVTSSTFQNNSALNDGGGFFNGGDMTLLNSTLSDNVAGEEGGAIYTRDYKLKVSDSTLMNNEASSGSGLYNLNSPVELLNSIIASSQSGANCAGGIPIASLGYNISSDDTCNLTMPGDLPNTDPLLGSLHDNGGPTLTHALLEGSPAIDAGDGFACPLTDQRGELRPADGDGDGTAVCDIGAFELTLEPIELPDISVDDMTVTEGDSMVTATFTVSLSISSTLPITVSYETADETAVSGKDYLSISGTLVFAAGTLTQTVQVIILGDTVNEPDETFSLHLSAPSNATLGDGDAIATILDNDEPPSYKLYLPIVVKP